MADEITAFKITIGSATFTQKAPDGVERIVVEDSLSAIARAEIVFHSVASSWSGIKIGDEVKISLAGEGEDIFFGFVWSRRVSVKLGAMKLTISAMGPLCKMMTTMKTQVFESQKDSDVIRTLISDAGLKEGSITTTKKTWDSIVQRTESHLDLARRLCARNGLWLFSKVDKVHAEQPAASGDAIGVPLLDVIEFESQVAEGTLPTEVTSLGWDYNAKNSVTGSFKDDRDFGPGAAIKRAFWKTPMHLPNVWVDDQEVAKTMAEAVFNRHSMSVQKGRLRCKGKGSFRAGAKVVVEDLGAGFGGGGLIMSTRHVVSSTRGYEVEVMFQSGVDWV